MGRWLRNGWVAALVAMTSTAEADVNAWDRIGRWPTNVVMLTGPSGSPPGTWVTTPIVFTPGGPLDGLIGVYATNFGFGSIVGAPRDATGLLFKGTIEDPEFGTGKVKFIMSPTLDAFTGTVRFKSAIGTYKGTVEATYERPPPTGRQDVSSVRLSVEFSGKRAGTGYEAGGTAALAVILENDGPQALPFGVHEIALDLFVEDDAGVRTPISTEITRLIVAFGKRRIRFDDLEVPPATLIPVHLPGLAKDRTTYGLKFGVPADARGVQLVAVARLLPVDPGRDPDPGLVDEATAPLRNASDVTIRFRLHNGDSETPIHIFLTSEPEDTWYTEATRISPNGTRTRKVTVPEGTLVEFGCGRQGTLFDKCSGTAVKSGTARITYDPTNPPFLALECGG